MKSTAVVPEPGPGVEALIKGVPGSWLVAGPVHSREELFSRCGQDDLPVRHGDQAELGVKVAAAASTALLGH